jgi:hypothetical protein
MSYLLLTKQDKKIINPILYTITRNNFISIFFIHTIYIFYAMEQLTIQTRWQVTDASSRNKRDQ